MNIFFVLWKGIRFLLFSCFGCILHFFFKLTLLGHACRIVWGVLIVQHRNDTPNEVSMLSRENISSFLLAKQMRFWNQPVEFYLIDPPPSFQFPSLKILHLHEITYILLLSDHKIGSSDIKSGQTFKYYDFPISRWKMHFLELSRLKREFFTCKLRSIKVRYLKCT